MTKTIRVGLSSPAGGTCERPDSASHRRSKAVQRLRKLRDSLREVCEKYSGTFCTEGQKFRVDGKRQAHRRAAGLRRLI